MNPDSPSTDRFEDRLLAAILDDYDNLTAVTESPEAAFLSLGASASSGGSGRRMMPAMVGTAAAVGLAVGGIAVTDGFHHSSPKVDHAGVHASVAKRTSKGSGPVMELASYRLRLPSRYRLTAAATTECTALGTAFVLPDPTSGGPATGQASTAQIPPYAPQVAAAASDEGGCVAMVLAPPYTPTAADPDPESGTFENSPPVQVGPYEGRAGTWTSFAKPLEVATQEASLYVEIPVGGGQDQDLVVSANNLSVTALISLVANGLTVAGSSSASQGTSPT